MPGHDTIPDADQLDRVGKRQANSNAQPILPDEEQRLLSEWNSTSVDYPLEDCLHEHFEAQVSRTPDSVAVVFEGASLTYRELDRKANQLARYLRSLGVGPNDLVAICMERSLELVIALLGTLKSGGAYVPIDPDYPKERVDFMLEDVGGLVLSQSEIAKALGIDESATRAICLDADWGTISTFADTTLERVNTSDDLAYVIYTSGSTGKPKGALNSHRGICNRLLWMQDTYCLTENDTILQKTAFSFDVSVWEFFWPLMAGARVVLAKPGGHRDGRYLVELIVRERVSVLHFGPSMLRLFLEEPGIHACTSLRDVFCGGEALSLELQEKFFKRLNARLHNLYGPTETAINVTRWTCRIGERLRNIPIGKPIANTSIYILDSNMEPVPIGQEGELYIGGVQVGLGYLNRPDLTKKSFLSDPFVSDPDARLYKTGDLARYRLDGNIEFLGRIDHQVKIRGYRIELGEIEHAAQTHPDVEQCIVVAREDVPEDRRLVAYIRAVDADMPSLTQIRSYLETKLPEYMVPSAFLPISVVPLSPNGKVDRDALPAPAKSRPKLDKVYVGPRGELECYLARLWSETLHLEQVGRHDNFFELGGDSLRAMTVLHKLQKQVGVLASVLKVFEHPTIEKFEKFLRKEYPPEINKSFPGGEKFDSECKERESAKKVVKKKTELDSPKVGGSFCKAAVPLTDGQQEILLGAFLGKDANCAFNLSHCLYLSGAINTQALETAIQEVVDRFDALRATISEDGQHMRIASHLALEVPQIDLSDEPRAVAESRLAELEREEIETPFDLERGPLFRVRVIRISKYKHVVIFTAHHVIFDGWSRQVMLKELGEAYSAAVRENSRELSDPVLFSDYAESQFAAKEGDEFAQSKAFWLEQLSGRLPVLDLPLDRPRSPQRTYKSSRQKLDLDPDSARMLRRIAAKQSSTLYTLLLSAYQAYLFRLTGQSDLVIGIASAGQPAEGNFELVGHCANVLPIRKKIDGGMLFDEFVASTRGLVFDAFEHQSCSFGSLLNDLDMARDPSRAPLLSATFNFDSSTPEFTFCGLGAEVKSNPTRYLMFDFHFNVLDHGDGLTIECAFNEHLFDRSTIQRRLKEFEALLDGLVEDPGIPIGKLPILPDEEQRLLSEWNSTSVDYPLEDCLHEHFEAQVSRTPDSVAVVFEGVSLTYRELDRKANQLARYLRSLGVGPNDLVAICMERSLELVIALLGTLKSGGAYVPIDPDYPKERVDFMLEDVGGLVLSQSEIAKELGIDESATRAICLDADWGTISTFADTTLERVNTSDDLAYVIYTSGSTGKPKGALNSHRGICNRLLWMQDAYCLTESDAVLQKTAFSFDVSVGEFFWPLMAGARIVLPKPGGHRDIQYLVDLTDRENVSVLNTVPSMLRLFLEEPGIHACTSLRDVFCGGEALSLELQDMFFELLDARLHNQYGPSEAAISVTHWSCQREKNQRNTPIGTPIANTSIYILDSNMEPVPIGQEGELYIGGVQVGLGYLNRPDLTKKSFLSDPFVSDPDARLYKTGDLARHLADGNIEFLGRIDHQVKIRGYRIELGEIETVLSGHPAVAESVATVHEYGPSDRRILAYYRLKAEFNGPGVKDLREHIRQELPAHMVPSDFIKVEEFPLSPTGKIDRKKLPEPETTSSAETAAFVAPEGEYEQALATIWREFLSHDEVSATADFFELGGDSLTAFRMLAKVRTTFGIRMPASSFLSEPTVRQLASYVENKLPSE